MPESRIINRDDLVAGLARKRERIASALQNMGFDDDLDPTARERLVDIVRHFQTAFQLFRRLQGPNRASRIDATRGDSQRRMFFRKIDAAIGAVEDALAYATD